ncbi:MAG: hypothetical protein PF440_08865, partial [Thiomicrorhabdus sp.]|nr:hypothetical protein [Thiomicrorhabdus sp.]
YSDGSKGFETGNTQKDSIFGFDPTTITDTAHEAVTQKAKDIVEIAEELAAEGFASAGSQSDIPTNPADYTQSHTVDEYNYMQVYDGIKDDSIVHDSPEHDAHLKHILDQVISKVMDPIKMYFMDNPELEAQGIYQPDGSGGQIFVSNQSAAAYGPLPRGLVNGLRMSSGEVYTHELIHPIIYAALRKSPRLTSQVQALYDLAEKQLSVRDLLNDPTIDMDDEANRYEVEAARARWDKIFDPQVDITYPVNELTGKQEKKTDSHGLDEFMALGLTNANFNKALTKIDLTSKIKAKISNRLTDVIGINGQETIMNIWNKIAEFIQLKFTNRTPQQNVAKELEQLAFALGNLDSFNKTRLAHLMNVSERSAQIIAKYGDKYTRMLWDNPASQVAIGKVKSGLKVVDTQIKDSDTVLGQRYREMRYLLDSTDRSLVNAAIDEVKGVSERIKPFIALNTTRNIILDQARNRVKEHMIQNLNKSFSKITEQLGRELNTEEKTMLTKVVLHTDLSHLHELMSMNSIKELVQNPAALSAQIKSLEDQFVTDPALNPHQHYLHKSSKSLGYFMVHGRGISAEAEPLQNAKTIANMKNTATERGLSEASITKAEVIVDQLATLYALQFTSKDNRKSLSGFMDMDLDAIEDVMTQHLELKKEALQTLFKDNKYQFIKGYTKQRLDPHINLEFGTKDDAEAFAKNGFLPSGEPLQRDAHDPVQDQIVLYTNHLGSLNDFQSGGMSTVSNTAKGTTVYEVLQQTGSRSKGTRETSQLIKRKNIVFERMWDPGTVTPDGSNVMVPIVDSQGNVVKYRYMMTELTKDEHMNQDNEFDSLMGDMKGQIIEKSVTPEINEHWIDALKDLYDETYQDNPDLFEEISPYAESERHRDIYHTIPQAAQDHMRDTWGTNKMYVPRDIVDLSFGYRKYSVIEMFQKDPKDRKAFERIYVNSMNLAFGMNGINQAKNMEDWMKSFTGLAKNAIVVKSATVTGGNFESNMMYLKSKGLTNREVYKWVTSATDYGLRYQVAVKRLSELKYIRDNILTKQLSSSFTKANQETQLRNLKRKITETETRISNNPATTFIESGGMPSLVDDVDTASTDAAFPNAPEKVMKEHFERLPKSAQKLGRALFMTDDQTSYKILNNAVKMTDYVARYALYQSYTQGQGMSHKEAMIRVREEFINFDIPTHKMIQYSNDIGVL